MPNFKASMFNNKKKYLKVADPLKKSRLLFFGCFDLESGRIKLSRPCPSLFETKSVLLSGSNAASIIFLKMDSLIATTFTLF